MQDRKWDVLYIGFHNQFNIEAIQWFMERVYPLFDPKLQLLFVGSASNYVDCKRSNIEIISCADDLTELYSNARVPICPMFTELA